MTIGLSCKTIEPSLTHHLDGIGVYTLNLLLNYRKMNIDVKPLIFPSAFSFRKHPELQLENAEYFSHSLPYSALQGIFLNQPISHGNIDLFHATDYRVPKLRCPVIASLHDAVPLKFPEWSNPRFRSLKNWVQKRLAQFSSHVIAISEAMVPDIVEYFGIPPEKISVVHMGIDEKWFGRMDTRFLEKTLEKYQLKQNGYFLFVGTLQPRKNILRIIEAYKLLPKDIRAEKKLLIVGKLGWCVDHVIDELKNLMSKGEAIWRQNVRDEEELRALYQAANIFIFPSLFEGFGIPILEAFASQTPVVTSNTTSLPEASAGAALEIDPTSVEEISNAIQLLVENQQMRETCISKGLVRAKQLSWKKCAEKTLEIYGQFIEVKRGR